MTGLPSLRRRATGPTRRILVARQDNIGDVVLAGPAVRALARRGEVTMLCGPSGAAAARLLPGVHDVIEHAAPWIGDHAPPVSRHAVDDLCETIRSRDFDEAYVLTSWHQSPLPLALVLRLAGVPRIAANCEDHPGSLLDLRRMPEPELHEVQQNLALVTAATGLVLDDDRLALRPVPKSRYRVAGPYVVVHPGASVPARGLAPALAAGVLEELTAAGHTVIVTGRPGEHHVRGTDRSHGVLDLTGRLELAELVDVLAHASAIVCGNTGPAHLAAAVGTPVVSVFAPVVPLHRWRPWRVPSAILGTQDVVCRGCRSRTCPYEQQHCTAGVRPEHVGDAVARLTRTPDQVGS